MRALGSLLLLFLASSLHGQDYVQYLIPVAGNNTSGSNGSLWTTELTIHNPRDKELTIIGDVCSGLPFLTPPCAPSFTLPAGISSKIDLTPRQGSEGVFLYVPKDLNYGPTPMTLRVRDLTKSAVSFGTEIPIVRTTEFAQLVIITDVPADVRHRATLRIYNANEYPRDVVMRVYTLEGQQPIEERAVKLDGIVPIVFNPTPLHPGYAQIDPLTPAVRAAAERVRIEIFDPLASIVSPPPPPLWALVSITNNDTQQVTTITPHP
jgi:hypothetical protein